MQLPLKEKSLSQFFSSFLKWRYNSAYFQQNLTLIADVFPKLRITRNVVR